MAHSPLSIDAIHQMFLDELAAQSAESQRHLASSHWIDRYTGRNIGLDERDAIWAMQRVEQAPSDTERDDPAAYLDRLLTDLAGVADRFRAEAPDPDGYGIATIGTVIRHLASLKAAD